MTDNVFNFSHELVQTTPQILRMIPNHEAWLGIPSSKLRGYLQFPHQDSWLIYPEDFRQQSEETYHGNHHQGLNINIQIPWTPQYDPTQGVWSRSGSTLFSSWFEYDRRKMELEHLVFYNHVFQLKELALAKIAHYEDLRDRALMLEANIPENDYSEIYDYSQAVIDHLNNDLITIFDVDLDEIQQNLDFLATTVEGDYPVGPPSPRYYQIQLQLPINDFWFILRLQDLSRYFDSGNSDFGAAKIFVILEGRKYSLLYREGHREDLAYHYHSLVCPSDITEVDLELSPPGAEGEDIIYKTYKGSTFPLIASQIRHDHSGYLIRATVPNVFHFSNYRKYKHLYYETDRGSYTLLAVNRDNRLAYDMHKLKHIDGMVWPSEETDEIAPARVWFQTNTFPKLIAMCHNAFNLHTWSTQARGKKSIEADIVYRDWEHNFALSGLAPWDNDMEYLVGDYSKNYFEGLDSDETIFRDPRQYVYTSTAANMSLHTIAKNIRQYKIEGNAPYVNRNSNIPLEQHKVLDRIGVDSTIQWCGGGSGSPNDFQHGTYWDSQTRHHMNDTGRWVPPVLAIDSNMSWIFGTNDLTTRYEDNNDPENPLVGYRRGRTVSATHGDASYNYKNTSYGVPYQFQIGACSFELPIYQGGQSDREVDFTFSTVYEYSPQPVWNVGDPPVNPVQWIYKIKSEYVYDFEYWDQGCISDPPGSPLQVGIRNQYSVKVIIHRNHIIYYNYAVNVIGNFIEHYKEYRDSDYSVVNFQPGPGHSVSQDNNFTEKTDQQLIDYINGDITWDDSGNNSKLLTEFNQPVGWMFPRTIYNEPWGVNLYYLSFNDFAFSDIETIPNEHHPLFDVDYEVDLIT